MTRCTVGDRVLVVSVCNSAGPEILIGRTGTVVAVDGGVAGDLVAVKGLTGELDEARRGRYLFAPCDLERVA